MDEENFLNEKLSAAEKSSFTRSLWNELGLSYLSLLLLSPIDVSLTLSQLQYHPKKYRKYIKKKDSDHQQHPDNNSINNFSSHSTPNLLQQQQQQYPFPYNNIKVEKFIGERQIWSDDVSSSLDSRSSSSLKRINTNTSDFKEKEKNNYKNNKFYNEEDEDQKSGNNKYKDKNNDDFSYHPPLNSLEEKLLEADHYLRQSSNLVHLEELKRGDFLYRQETKSTDANGYVIETDHHDNDLLSSHTFRSHLSIIPSRNMIEEPLREKGTIQSLKTIIRSQGFFSLWKGNWASWIYFLSKKFINTVLSITIRNYLLESGCSDFNCEMLSNFAGQFVSSMLLIPLEVIRVRLITQSSISVEKKYFGLIDALKTIYLEEGFFSIYEQLFTSSVLAYGILPWIRNGALIILSRILKEKEISWSSWLIISSVGYWVYLSFFWPLDLIRKRIMIQPKRIGSSMTTYAISSSSSPNFQNKKCSSWFWMKNSILTSYFYPQVHYIGRPHIWCIAISPFYYTSAWDAFVRIIQEEGFLSLYTGFSLKIVSWTLNTLLEAANLMLSQSNDLDVDEDDDNQFLGSIRASRNILDSSQN